MLILSGSADMALFVVQLMACNIDYSCRLSQHFERVSLIQCRGASSLLHSTTEWLDPRHSYSILLSQKPSVLLRPQASQGRSLAGSSNCTIDTLLQYTAVDNDAD
ncbi:hypothetical protein R6Q59_010074 [Mikania micrantha]